METSNKNKIIIISGLRGSGKTTLLKKCIDVLVSSGISVGGIITLSENVKRYDRKQYYFAQDIESGTKNLLLSKEPSFHGNDLAVGPFLMHLETLEWSERRLTHAAENCSAVALDELGPLELKEKAYFSIAKKADIRIYRDIVFSDSVGNIE